MLNRRDFTKLAALSAVGVQFGRDRAIAQPRRFITIDKLTAPVLVRQSTGVIRARLGQRLFEGNGVYIPAASDARFNLDVSQGYFLVVPPTEFYLQRLRWYGCGAWTRIILHSGRIYSGLRPFTCKDSRYEIADFAQGRTITHRGTEYAVSSIGNRMVVGVSSGMAIAKSAEVKEEIPPGFGGLLLPKMPPTLIPIDYEMKLENLAIEQTRPGVIKVLGDSNALNSVTVEGVNAVEYCPLGLDKWRWMAEVPKPASKIVNIEITNAVGLKASAQLRGNYA